jgi:hypothetical protein
MDVYRARRSSRRLRDRLLPETGGATAGEGSGALCNALRKLMHAPVCQTREQAVVKSWNGVDARHQLPFFESSFDFVRIRRIASRSLTGSLDIGEVDWLGAIIATRAIVALCSISACRESPTLSPSSGKNSPRCMRLIRVAQYRIGFLTCSIAMRPVSSSRICCAWS